MSCDTCVFYPPSACDGKPCCVCDTDDVLFNCYQPACEKEGADMVEYELELCPFCGNKAQVRYTGCGSGSHGYTSNILMRSKAGFVICLKCGCRTPIHSKVSRAINKWNRRADNG